MEIKRKNHTYFSFVVFLILSLLSPACSELENTQINGSVIITAYEIHVGVILNMGSWATGKMSESCISMAVSDFYNLNTHYKTRLVLHTRDSKGDPMRTLSQALDLMRSIKLQAIVGGETSFEAKILAELGVKAKIPIISFFSIGPSPSLAEYPYFVQTVQDGTSQVNGIAAVIKTFRWRSVNLIYEDTEFGREIIPYMISSFQDMEIHINYKIVIPLASTDEQLIKQLSKLMTSSQTSVYVVHTSPSLASQLFFNAKMLGMMSEGYVWIITDKIVNFLHSMDSIVIESMEGTLGLKPYIQSSKKLHNFTLRWKREFYIQVMMELNVYGVWAYDTIWALALAAERVSNGHSQSGSRLHMEILQCRFKGLGGDFGIIDGKLISSGFEIVNVIGKGDRRVGFWTPTNGIMKDMKQSMKRMNFSSPSDLEAIIWPGGSTMIPKSQIMHMSGKKLKIGIPVKLAFHELVNVNRDPQTNTTIVTGFCIDVFKVAIEGLEYEVLYELFPFEDANGDMAGTYNDLIDQVYLQNYDAVVGDVTITANRSLYVDFTMPFTDLGLGMIVPITNNNNDMWIFLKPLTTELWVTSAVFFILIGFVVWVIEHRINAQFQGPPTQQIGTVFWFSFSTLVFAHRETLQSNLSKFVVTVWLFVVLILSSSYTATLTSMLTVQQIQLGSANYIGYHLDSVISKGVVMNFNFTDPRIRPYISPEEYIDALSRGSKNAGVSAIIEEIPYIKIIVGRYPTRYTMIEPTFTSNGFAFAFPKGSPLIPDISREIAKLREEGKLKMMENAWFKGQSTIAADDQYSTSNPNSLNLSNFRGLFLIIGFSSTLALVIFSIFMFYEKRHVIGIYWSLIQGRLEFLKRYLAIMLQLACRI